MAVQHFRDNGPIGQLVDALVSIEANQPHEPALRSIQRTYDEMVDAAKKVNESKKLTGLGKREARKRLMEQAEAKLDKQDEHVTRLAEKAASTRARALAIPPSERTPEVLMLEREVRDRLAAEKVDALSLGPRYYSAIAQGDWQFVRALENAPQSFSLLTDAMRAHGEEEKLQRSSLGDQVAAEESTHQVFRQVLNTSRTEINKLWRREYQAAPGASF